MVTKTRARRCNVNCYPNWIEMRSKHPLPISVFTTHRADYNIRFIQEDVPWAASTKPFRMWSSSWNPSAFINRWACHIIHNPTRIQRNKLVRWHRTYSFEYVQPNRHNYWWLSAVLQSHSFDGRRLVIPFKDSTLKVSTETKIRWKLVFPRDSTLIQTGITVYIVPLFNNDTTVHIISILPNWFNQENHVRQLTNTRSHVEQWEEQKTSELDVTKLCMDTSSGPLDYPQQPWWLTKPIIFQVANHARPH